MPIDFYKSPSRNRSDLKAASPIRRIKSNGYASRTVAMFDDRRVAVGGGALVPLLHAYCHQRLRDRDI